MSTVPFKKDEGPPARETKNLKTDVDAAGPIEDDDSDVVPIDSKSGPGLTNGNYAGDPSLFVMRQIPMGYSELRNSAYSYRPTYSPPSQLGMLERLDESSYDGRSVRIADRNDEEEKKRFSELFGQNGQISLYWPADLCDRYFDLDRYERTEQITSSSAMALKENSKVISVSNWCIEKYCKMEQLEETEMWYCNKCKEHVRAWKQLHLYRTPPIRIVHLKRFHCSASTHRRDKIDAFINFPLTDLDLTSEVMHWSGSEKPIYDCYAVSNHYGGLGGGHYAAAICTE